MMTYEDSIVAVDRSAFQNRILKAVLLLLCVLLPILLSLLGQDALAASFGRTDPINLAWI